MNITSRFKNLITAENDFKTSSEPSTGEKAKEAVATGLITGTIGAGVGGLIGGLVGRSGAVDSYESSTETTQVELSWEVPVYESEVLGEIPRDEYLRPSLLNHLGIDKKPSRINPNTEPVSRTNPVIDDSGDVTWQTKTEVFEGYGNSHVSWATNRIVSHELTGYNRSVSSQYEGQWSCQSNWLPPEDKELVGWCVDYKPRIKRHELGEYETPKVNFSRPSDVRDQIRSAAWSGALKGAGIGFATGLAVGLVGSMLMKSVDA